MNSFIFYAPIQVVRLKTQTLMDGPVVGLRLRKLWILITSLWAVTSYRQFWTFILAVSEERTILIWLCLFSFIPFFLTPMLIFFFFKSTLVALLVLVLPFVQQDPISHTRTHSSSSRCLTLFISTLSRIALFLSFFILISRYLNLGVNRPIFFSFSRCQDLCLPFGQPKLYHMHP